jgi:hypothetical protein
MDQGYGSWEMTYSLLTPEEDPLRPGTLTYSSDRKCWKWIDNVKISWIRFHDRGTKCVLLKLGRSADLAWQRVLRRAVAYPAAELDVIRVSQAPVSILNGVYLSFEEQGDRFHYRNTNGANISWQSQMSGDSQWTLTMPSGEVSCYINSEDLRPPSGTWRQAEEDGFCLVSTVSPPHLEKWPHSMYSGLGVNSNTFIRWLLEDLFVEMSWSHPGEDAAAVGLRAADDYSPQPIPSTADKPAHPPGEWDEC